MTDTGQESVAKVLECHLSARNAMYNISIFQFAMSPSFTAPFPSCCPFLHVFQEYAEFLEISAVI